MAILDSVRELASKLGAETNGRDITDQLNKINKHLEADTANDIAGAVKEYSKKAGSGGGGGETFEVEVEITITGGGYITTVNKTYQQIKSEIDLGKTISGTLTGFYDSSELFSGELSNSYVKDFYGSSGTKEADDAIFIVTEPLLYTDPSHSQTMSAIFSVAITPDNIVWMTAGYAWSSNPET